MNDKRSELCALYLVLKSDVDQCKENLSDTHTGFWDRTYTKTTFSMIEGVSFRVRQYIVAAATSSIYTIDSPSLNFLNELTYKLDKNGKIEEKNEYLIFLPGFKFTFKTWGNCLNMEDFVEKAFSHNGFSDFKKSVEIRNRLTHPKTTQEMLVSETELKIIKSAEQWFHSLVTPLLEKALEIENQKTLIINSCSN